MSEHTELWPWNPPHPSSINFFLQSVSKLPLKCDKRLKEEQHRNKAGFQIGIIIACLFTFIFLLN